jgi:hypothetical protein
VFFFFLIPEFLDEIVKEVEKEKQEKERNNNNKTEKIYGVVDENIIPEENKIVDSNASPKIDDTNLKRVNNSGEIEFSGKQEKVFDFIY